MSITRDQLDAIEKAYWTDEFSKVLPYMPDLIVLAREALQSRQTFKSSDELPMYVFSHNPLTPEQREDLDNLLGAAASGAERDTKRQGDGDEAKYDTSTAHFCA